MLHALSRAKLLLITTAAVAALLASSTARANAPLQFGPFTDSYSSIGMNCDGFDVLVQGTETKRFTVFLDDAGELSKVIKYDSAPHDTLTNTVTGKSIVVRGEFSEIIERIPGTDEFTKTVVGHRYLVTEPGIGVTVRDVGRITYGDLEQTIVLWQAGKHDIVLASEIEPTFCAALA
jgi:hypothetical protein